MKIKIRSGVFETNSSSMHSICVLKNLKEDKNIEKLNYLWFSSFGKLSYFSESNFNFDRYSFKILATAEDKIPYIYASLCPGKRLDTDPLFKKTNDCVIEAIKTKYPETKEIDFPYSFDEYGFNKLLVDSKRNLYTKYDERVIYEPEKGVKKPFSDYKLKETGERLKISRSKKQTYYCGYIDHQSSDLFKNFFAKSGISLEEFIFNSKYIVIIDEDEYCHFNKMQLVGLINKENIEKTYSIW